MKMSWEEFIKKLRIFNQLELNDDEVGKISKIIGNYLSYDKKYFYREITIDNVPLKYSFAIKINNERTFLIIKLEDDWYCTLEINNFKFTKIFCFDGFDDLLEYIIKGFYR